MLDTEAGYPRGVLCAKPVLWAGTGGSGKLMSVCLLAGFGVLTFSCFADVRK